MNQCVVWVYIILSIDHLAGATRSPPEIQGCRNFKSPRNEKTVASWIQLLLRALDNVAQDESNTLPPRGLKA